MSTETQKPPRSPFPPLYWLVILFEFFERGSYYGMMSVLSIYMTEVLGFTKPDVGVIKATIQPLLYFLPILAGALADRFGYRRALLVAFSLLGSGYFLTSQATEYRYVFLALVVMGLGAGTFKPVISGAIARCTDETNSTIGFGIYYWSINLGAFLFPLVLVPLLKKNLGWEWVILASAIGTGAMVLPTLLVFREPPSPKAEPAARPSLLQTLANAFEIIYSPFILLYHFARRSAAGKGLLLALLALLLGYGGWRLFGPQETSQLLAAPVYHAAERGSGAGLAVRVARNLSKPRPFTLELERAPARLTIHAPDRIAGSAPELLAALHQQPGLRWVARAHLERFAAAASHKTTLVVVVGGGGPEPWRLERGAERLTLALSGAGAYRAAAPEILVRLRADPLLTGLEPAELDALVAKAEARPILLLFIGLLLLGSLVALRLSARFRAAPLGGKLGLLLATVGTLEAILVALHLLGLLSLFATVLCGIIATTLCALFAIDHADPQRFVDHLRFLTMIFLYSGFWVLYFQMFDSVLWYVQAYVDASSLDRAVNAFLAAVGLTPDWRFDVEHVTVINAGTIILLQLLISTIVKNTRALPTMIAGIGLGTLGMAVLAVSTQIWVFMLGITIFSIGEMTAHPKFISYVGQTAPKARVAMYMGYLFLYGVIGSSIGSMVGANLYVRFVDEAGQPRTLWLIFAGIGLVTILGLLAFNRFWGRKDER